MPGGANDHALLWSYQPYHTAHIKIQYKGVGNFRLASTGQLQELFKYIVENEGPIAVGLAKRRIINAYSIDRAGARIVDALEYAIYAAVQKGLFRRNGEFLWPKDVNTIVVRIPRNGEGSRSIEEIPPEELQQGIYLCIKSALSMEKEDLIKQTAKLFGLKASNKVIPIIEKNLEKLVLSKKLAFREGKIRLP